VGTKEVIQAWDEASRLDALRALKLLDTPPEERFDRVTRMVKTVLKVPTALISLVDAERQWFKSRDGLDASQTARDISFCTHAILQDDVFVVEDAWADPKFADNPLVTGPPYIRFYAGKPLFSTTGKKVGTLCVLDSRPRQLSEEEEAKLASLAGWAEREINHFADETEALSRLENKLKLAHALENASDGIISTDMDGVIESMNPAACQMFRYQAVDLIGKNVSALVPARQHVQHFDFMSRLRNDIAESTRNCLELIAVRNGGEEFPVELSFRKLQVAERLFFVGIVRDISERKFLERVKNDFLASVSHELRTPLTSILGALGMLKDDNSLSNAGDRELLEIAYLNSQRMNVLINDILDTEKLDADVMAFFNEKVSSADLLEEARKLNDAYAQSEKIKLVVNAPTDTLTISVDRSRFIQVLTNLISNACKFSPTGETVSISVERDGNWAIFKVIDHGEGIPDEFRSKMFQRFAQARPTKTNARQGTGLGLSISKTMVEKMGGYIGFESVVGRGTCFFVRMPLISAH
jgi:PAS domain S-box-containing protein